MQKTALALQKRGFRGKGSRPLFLDRTHMKRLVIVLAAAMAGAGCAGRDRTDLEAQRLRWKWCDPGAIVLEVQAAESFAGVADLVTLEGGQEEGLAPDLVMGIYRSGRWVATLRVLEVGPVWTQGKIVEGSAGDVKPGDVAVYLPMRGRGPLGRGV